RMKIAKLVILVAGLISSAASVWLVMADESEIWDAFNSLIGLIFGFAMIPHWNLDNISAFPAASVFFRDVLLTIPFCFFSAVF
ncbi:hypothetical protein MJL48_35140, partial [Salmonella enterica subsp. enterica serovar Kentucky]|nr:hypothetical protein [Salmonella enterica subsp. enterica serovar Kentucky]